MININDKFPMAKDYENPFSYPALRSASIFELIKDLFNPKKRQFNCLQVEITSICSAKCTYCPHTTKFTKWNSRHMQAHTFVNLWPLLQNVTRVHLQGWGEPFLNPNFFNFVALARRAGCLVSSTSCGLYINEEIAQKIINSGLDIIAFSLVGTDQITNNPRQGADFDKVYQGIKLLQDLRQKKMAVHLEIHLAYLLLTDRLEALYKLPKLMKELNIHATIISTLDYLADESQAHLAINPNDEKTIIKARAIFKEIKKEIKANGQELFYALPSSIASSSCREDIQNSLYVDADGNISPCIYLNVPDFDSQKTIFGNVNEENVITIWNNKKFENFRKNHFDNTPILQCQNCVKKFENLS